MGSPTVFCPSCGDEYVAGSNFCSDCRVALVDERPDRLDPVGGDSEPAGDLPDGFVELGSWPPMATVIILRRLRDAGVDVSTLWSSPDDGLSVIAVPEGQLDFADAVLRELPIDDEMPQGSRQSYVDRIEARLAEVAILLDELRQLEAGQGFEPDGFDGLGPRPY